MVKKCLIGIIAGIISGLFSTGGGMILVPAFIYMLKEDATKARGTSVFCILPMVIFTAIIYGRNNFIDWNLGIKCAVGGILGGFLGGKLLSKIKDKYLQITFIIFLFYAGINMILRWFRENMHWGGNEIL